MSRTLLDQDKQIRQSRVYTDTEPAGSTLESGAADIQDDLNAVRSQLRRAIYEDSAGNWYDDIPTVNGKKRAILDLNTGLNAIEVKSALTRTAVFTNITVAPGTNWAVLSVSGLQAPTTPAAVGVTTSGAVVAQSAFSGASFSQYESVEVPGPDALTAKNLVFIRSAANGFSLPSAGRLILGLLQYESTGVDGGPFNDTPNGNRVKLSFVRLNPTLNGLEECPPSDIQGQVVNYAYVQRTPFDLLPEQGWLDDEPFAQPLPSGVSELDFLLDCDPDAVNNTNTLTRSGGLVSNETWVNVATTKPIKSIDYVRTNSVVTSEVVKVYAEDGITVVAQKTVTYTRTAGRVTTIAAVRNV